MANSFNDPTFFTKAAIAMLHSKSVVVRSLNRQYDDQFAKSGGKIGNSLRIRKPNKFAVTQSRNLGTQDMTETSTTLTAATQIHVPLYFTSAELSLSVDDFSSRYLEPAMAQLAATLDYNVLNGLVPTVYNISDPTETSGGSLTMTNVPDALLTWAKANAKLDIGLAPRDGNRVALVGPYDQAALMDALKSLLNPAAKIGSQYDNGLMGNAIDLNFKLCPKVYGFTTGTRTNTTPVITGTTTTNGTTTLDFDGGTTSGTTKVGDRFMIEDCYSVDPETKQSTGRLQQFVVIANTGSGQYASGTYTATGGAVTAMAFSPAIYTSGVQQNVSSTGLVDGKGIFNIGIASTSYRQNLVAHRDFATVVTADLEVPKGVDFAAREMYEGISMRVVRDYDINSDSFPIRIDILYGFKELYPEWACIVGGDAA